VVGPQNIVHPQPHRFEVQFGICVANAKQHDCITLIDIKASRHCRAHLV